MNTHSQHILLTSYHISLDRTINTFFPYTILPDTNLSLSTMMIMMIIGTKEWLRGFYFQDESIMAHELTNAQLAAILDPTSDSYRDLIGNIINITT